MLEKFVAMDLEMTGLVPSEDRILEIGAVKYNNGKEVDSFHRLIHPHRVLTDEIKSLTGITQREAESGIEDVEGVREFLAFAEELPLVGHHISSDFSFLKQTGAKGRLQVTFQAVDTLKLARKFLPKEQKKSLEALCELYEISETKNHRALEDARATAALYLLLTEQFEGASEEAFIPVQLDYKIRKQSPASKIQIRNLKALLTYHHLDATVELDSLTRSEASRMTDKIIGKYGRIPKDGV